MILSRIRANVAEAVRSLRYGDYWVSLFIAGGTVTTALFLLWPGGTLDSYHVYNWISTVPDAALAALLLPLGLWAFVARGPTHRRVVALFLCFAWGTLAAAIALGTYHHAATTGSGPSLAVVHYAGWAALAFLSAFRATSQAPPPTDA
jgi:hypothetical protein